MSGSANRQRCHDDVVVLWCASVCAHACTSVVDIRGDLNVTLECVHRQIVEVFILLQRELSSKRQRIPILILHVDAHRVIIVELGSKLYIGQQTKKALNVSCIV